MVHNIVPPTLHSSMVQEKNIETSEKHTFCMNLGFDQIMEAFDFSLDTTSQIIPQAGKADHQNENRDSRSAITRLELVARSA